MTTPESELRQKIFERIDQNAGDLGYRPPAHIDIIQALYSEPRATIEVELKDMLAERVITTETGDSGVTYRRPRVYAPAPSRFVNDARPASPLDHVKVETQKQLKKTVTNAAVYQKYSIEETKAKMRGALQKPMSSTEYSKATGLPRATAYASLETYVKNGFLEKIKEGASWGYKYRISSKPKSDAQIAQERSLRPVSTSE